MADLSIFIAFAAGILSFLSPCILPLIPSYLCFIGGVSLNSLKVDAEKNDSSRREGRVRIIYRTIGFILGFSTVFIVLSVLFSTTFSLMHGVTKYINWAAGIIVIVLGLNIFFDFLRFLNYEKRFHSAKRPTSIIGAFIVGAAFGAGWTPCVGPILGSILLLAGQSGSLVTAILYLVSYSMGLGLPFLAAAIFFERFLNSAVKLRSFLPLIRNISGILLIIIGFLILLGRFQVFNIFVLKTQYRFIDWVEADGFLVRFIPALILLIAALLPLVILFVKKRLVISPKLIPCGIFFILALLQVMRLLNCAKLFADWLIYLQNI
jgi:cytochrome c-type biogenesis protein